MGKNIAKAYRATYIPEGYELVEEVNTKVDVSYKWKDLNGNLIILQQKNLDITSFLLDAESGNTKILDCDEYKVYCRVIDGLYYYIWTNQDYGFTLTSTTQLSNNELLEIINGII
jgi:hypothetical protein